MSCFLQGVGDILKKVSRWVSGTNTKKLDIQHKTISDIANQFCTDLDALARHMFDADWQLSQYKSLKESLPHKWLLSTVDFSENYKCFYQDGIGSAYYQQEQVEIHPTQLYYKCTCTESCDKVVSHSIIFISDDTKHDYQSVRLYNRKTVNMVPFKVQHHVQFSDNCPNQYKSKTPFLDMQEQDSSFERGYFGSRHGKSACDTLGGLLKSQAGRYVRSRKGVIQDASDLYDFAVSNLVIKEEHRKREFVYVPQDEIKLERENVATEPTNRVVGTQKIFSIKNGKDDSGHKQLLTRRDSCFCNGCLTNMDCVNKEKVGPWMAVKVPYKQISKRITRVKRKKDSADDDSTQRQAPPVAKKKDTTAEDSKQHLPPPLAKRKKAHTADNSKQYQPPPVAKRKKDPADESTQHQSPPVAKRKKDPAAADSIQHEPPPVAKRKKDPADDSTLHEPPPFANRKKDPADDDCKGGYACARNYPHSIKSLYFKNLAERQASCNNFNDLQQLCEQSEVQVDQLFPIQSVNKQTLYDVIDNKKQIDTYGNNIMPFDVIGQASLIAVGVYGDGNCLSRCGSILAYNCPHNFVEIRCRIVMYLCKMESLYTDPVYLKRGHENRDDLHERYAMYSAQDETLNDGVSLIYEQAAFRFRINATYGNIWGLFALSDILNSNIYSLYPHFGYNVRNDIHRLIPPSGPSDNIAYILWSNIHEETNPRTWAPDHFMVAMDTNERRDK